MFNSVKKVNISAANIRTNFQFTKTYSKILRYSLLYRKLFFIFATSKTKGYENICHGDRYLAYFKNH